MRSLYTLAAVAALSVASLQAQTPGSLSSGFAGGNGTGAGTTSYFDLNVTNPMGLTLTQLDLHINLAGTVADTCDVYIVSGAGATYRGNELAGIGGTFPTAPALAWPATPSFSLSYTSSGAIGTPAPANVPGGFFLAPGMHAIAIDWTGVGGPLYTNFNGGNNMFSNADVAFEGGSQTNGQFGPGLFGGGSGFRVPNIQLNYLTGNVSLASATEFGAGCPTLNDSAFVLEQFFVAAGQLGDLTGSSLTFTPNGTGGYLVSLGVNSTVAISGAGAIAGLGDDTLSGPLALPFAFTGPDGASTTSVELDTNGGIFTVDTGNVASVGGIFPADMVGGGGNPVINLGIDHDVTLGGTINYDIIGGNAVFTWDNVTEFGGASVNSTQIVLRPDSSFTFNFSAFTPSNTSNVGVGRGASSALTVDDLFTPTAPETDYSALVAPLDTGTNTAPLQLSALTNPVIGTSFDVEVSGVSNTAVGIFLLIGFANPMLPLDSLTLTGCSLLSSGEATLSLVPAPVIGSSTPIPNLASLQGGSLFLQAAGIDFGSPFALPFVFSNGLRADLERF